MLQDELLKHIENDQAPVIIDVRTIFEYQASHIPGAIHIPFWTLFFKEKLAGYDEAQLFVLYCEHGPRAVLAKWLINYAGFKQVEYLTGHMMAWKRSGFPVEKH